MNVRVLKVGRERIGEQETYKRTRLVIVENTCLMAIEVQSTAALYVSEAGLISSQQRALASSLLCKSQTTVCIQRLCRSTSAIFI